ncbi:hypothetical protein D3C87_124170 [compost metagenome]
MSASRWGASLISSLWIKLLALSTVLFLCACTPREIDVQFLKKLVSNPEFEVTNANDNKLDPSADLLTVPVEVSCSVLVSSIQVQNPTTSMWDDVSTVDTMADVDCTDGQASFRLPLDFLGFSYNPTDAGEVMHDFSLQWTFVDLSNESHSKSKTYKVLARPPLVSLSAPDISLANEASYLVSGTCSGTGDIEVEGPFDSSPLLTQCAASAWSVSAPVSSSAPASVEVSIKAYVGQDPRRGPFQIQQAQVTVDLIAPTLTLSDPTTDAIYSGAMVVHVKGSCSEALLQVQVMEGATVLAEGICTAVNTFDIALSALPDGAYSAVYAQQKDLVGNLGKSGFAQFLKDTTGPGAFTISGVKSMSNVDMTSDLRLSAPGLRVDVSASTEAQYYSVSITDLSDASVCAEQISSMTTFDFSNCLLVDGNRYKILASAEDQYGNPTKASNDAVEFLVQYDYPEVIAVTSTTANGAYNAGKSIEIRVKFNQAITVNGTPTLKLNAGPAASAAYFATVNTDTLRLMYTVAAGQNVEDLDYETTASLVGDISSTATELAAKLNLPATGSASSLAGGANLIVDTTLPLEVGGISRGTVPEDLVTVPSLNWTLSTSPDVVNYRVQVYREDTGVSVSENVFSAATGSMPAQTLPIGSALSPNVAVHFKVTAIDRAGNETTLIGGNYVTTVCPLFYVRVPASGAVPEFCVAKYEMKYPTGDGTGLGNNANSPQSMPSFLPWTGLSQTEAVGRCQSLGSTNYDLISLEQWQSLANNVVSQNPNWTGNVLYSGRLKAGVFGRSAAVTGEDTLRCQTMPCLPSDMTDRALVLSTGAAVWDISGNVGELVKQLATTVPGTSLNGYISQMIPSPLADVFGTDGFCANANVSPYCGYGKYSPLPFVDSFAVRGGDFFNSADDVGIFATFGLADTTTSRSSNTGFRCIYKP